MKCNSLIYFAAALMLGCFSLGAHAQAQTAACNKTVYLTFDTGNMSVAQKVAEILKRQNVKATFSLPMKNFSWRLRFRRFMETLLAGTF